MTAIYVPYLPVAQPRQRHRVFEVAGKMIASNYTPAKHPVNAFKAAIGQAWHEAEGGALDGPLFLDATFVLPRPKRLKLGSRVWHGARPDLDNLLKSTKDALVDCGAMTDDSRVSMTRAIKCYAADTELPHAEISLTQMED